MEKSFLVLLTRQSSIFYSGIFQPSGKFIFLISKSLVFGMGSFYIYLTMAFSVDLDNTRF